MNKPTKYKVLDENRILIRKGQYRGVEYFYGKVSFLESDTPTLNFTYNVVENPKDRNTESSDFQNVIGDILVDIIDKKCHNGTITETILGRSETDEQPD